MVNTRRTKQSQALVASSSQAGSSSMAESSSMFAATATQIQPSPMKRSGQHVTLSAKRKRKEEKDEPKELYTILKSLKQEVASHLLETHRIGKGWVPPPAVPLCRLQPNLQVRAVDETQLPKLVTSFKLNGYLSSQGSFICSIGDVLTEEEMASWSDEWKHANSLFEMELEKEVYLPWKNELDNRKYLVWDGNHRLAAFMSTIDEFKLSEEWYKPVNVKFIRYDRNETISLIGALQQLNLSNSAYAETTLPHTLMAVKNTCEHSEASEALFYSLDNAD